MLINLEIDLNKNEAILVYSNKRSVKLTSSKDTSIERFLDWFFSEEKYPLLTDEQFERTMETTQPIIDLKEVA